MARKTSPLNSVDILDSLRAYSFTLPYTLAIYGQGEGIVAKSVNSGKLCGFLGATANCGKSCTLPLEDAFKEALARNVPVIGRCPLGLLGFAIRLPDPELSNRCLVAWGVRTSSINLFYLESMSRSAGIKPFSVLDSLGALPVVELDEVRETADRVHRILPSTLGSNIHNHLLETAVSRLNSVVGISTQLDRGKTLDEVISLLSESFGVLFDCQQIAVAMSGHDNEAFNIRGTWGLPADLGHTSKGALSQLMAEHPGERSLRLMDETGELFHDLQAQSATFLPLMAGSELLGCILLPEIELQPRDALLAEILTGRAAARILQLRNEANHYSDSSLPARLIAMTDVMLEVTSEEELYAKILSTSAGFLGASSGSLMILDESGQTLRIVASLDLNEQLLKSLSIKSGEGIAGKVAATGLPIVVNDIETDSRVATANRPRYRTKSFISAPFRGSGRTMGVLNLSDKEGHDIFTENDLQLLSLLLGQAAMVLERTRSRVQAEILTNLSAVDPATNLYNRSFLDKRLAEEVNRSQRQELQFTTVLVELDHLSLYASICGAAAAASVIKKTVAAITRSARQMDVVCCLNSETFCLILPGTTKNASLPVAERIRKAVAKIKIPGQESLPTGKLSSSIGLAMFPDDGIEAEQLLNAGMAALQQAKAEGRDCIVLHEVAELPGEADMASVFLSERLKNVTSD
ncbi:MAG: diguanylate cyclase [Geobacteraceae bacterium]|nr:diguanylate cyclase [Geobacteraceae bacterium]